MKELSLQTKVLLHFIEAHKVLVLKIPIKGHTRADSFDTIQKKISRKEHKDQGDGSVGRT